MKKLSGLNYLIFSRLSHKTKGVKHWNYKEIREPIKKVINEKQVMSDKKVHI